MGRAGPSGAKSGGQTMGFQHVRTLAPIAVALLLALVLTAVGTALSTAAGTAPATVMACMNDDPHGAFDGCDV